MVEKVTGYIELQTPAGKTTPAPLIGPALGQHGVSIVQFTKEFNTRTTDQGDVITPTVTTIYADRSLSFIAKILPTVVLIKKTCNIGSGSGTPNKTKVAILKGADLQKITEIKMSDLSVASLETTMGMIAGTARSIGVTIEK